MRRYIYGFIPAFLIFAILRVTDTYFFGGWWDPPPYSEHTSEWIVLPQVVIYFSISLLPGYLVGRIIGRHGVAYGFTIGMVGGILLISAESVLHGYSIFFVFRLGNMYSVLHWGILNAAGGGVGELHYGKKHNLQP